MRWNYIRICLNGLLCVRTLENWSTNDCSTFDENQSKIILFITFIYFSTDISMKNCLLCLNHHHHTSISTSNSELNHLLLVSRTVTSQCVIWFDWLFTIQDYVRCCFKWNWRHWVNIFKFFTHFIEWQNCQRVSY